MAEAEAKEEAEVPLRTSLALQNRRGQRPSPPQQEQQETEHTLSALPQQPPPPPPPPQQQQPPPPQQQQPLRQVRRQQQAPGPPPRRRPRANAADACTGRSEAGRAHDAGIDPLDALVEQVLAPSSCPFQVLGLEPSASAAAVRKRYLRLALKLHPDKAAHVRAAEAFAALEHAYEHAYKRAQLKAQRDRQRRQCTPGS